MGIIIIKIEPSLKKEGLYQVRLIRDIYSFTFDFHASKEECVTYAQILREVLANPSAINTEVME